MEKKLYGLRTQRSEYEDSVIVQVSFNRQELEEIAEYLNSGKIRYFAPHATVVEIDQFNCEHYWPRGKM